MPPDKEADTLTSDMLSCRLGMSDGSKEERQAWAGVMTSPGKTSAKKRPTWFTVTLTPDYMERVNKENIIKQVNDANGEIFPY